MEKSQFTVTRFTAIPDWALCALEYGTYDNLTKEEIAMVKDFQSQFTNGYVMEVHWDTLGFSRYPEFGLACDTYEVSFYEPSK